MTSELKGFPNLCDESPEGIVTCRYEEAYLKDGKRTITGYCDGEGVLFFEYAGFTPEERADLETLWNEHEGLTGTGFYGEFRELEFIMGLFEKALGQSAEIPDSLRERIDQENILNPLERPIGDVW